MFPTNTVVKVHLGCQVLFQHHVLEGRSKQGQSGRSEAPASTTPPHRFIAHHTASIRKLFTSVFEGM